MRFPRFALLAALVAFAAGSRAATVTNLGMVEKDGLIIFLYDLAAPVPSTITLTVSGGGKRFEAPPDSLRGDFGPGVAPGQHHLLVWNPAACLSPKELAADYELDLNVTEPPFPGELTWAEEKLLGKCLEKSTGGECNMVLRKAARLNPSLFLEIISDPTSDLRTAAIRLAGDWGRRDAVYGLLKIVEETPLPEGDNTVRVAVRTQVRERSVSTSTQVVARPVFR